jgi:hypothetical protein
MVNANGARYAIDSTSGKARIVVVTARDIKPAKVAICQLSGKARIVEVAR